MISLLRCALVTAVVAIPAVAAAAPATNGVFVNTDVHNGVFVNGVFVNGVFVNTAVLDTRAVGSASAVAPTKAGHLLHQPAVHGNGLAGWAWDWSVGDWFWRDGTWFAGTELSAKAVDRATNAESLITLRIDRIDRAPGHRADADTDDAGNDVLLHWVTMKNVDPQGNVSWLPICRGSNNQALPAIMLRGEWSSAEGWSWGGDQISDDANVITFACANGALGKCAARCVGSAAECAAAGLDNALGYRRWRAPYSVHVTNGWVTEWVVRDFALDHQACTRMIRADYCGDGRSKTTPGTRIDVYDRSHLNNQAVTLGSRWNYEATWNADGAVRVGMCRQGMEEVTCGVVQDQPWQIARTFPRVCYTDNGLGGGTARIGNLRHFPQPFIVEPFRPFPF